MAYPGFPASISLATAKTAAPFCLPGHPRSDKCNKGEWPIVAVTIVAGLGPMLFDHPDDFANASKRAVTVFGMSGLGKTRLSARLRQHNWFHYSVDYRIGTRHMGEFIVDNFKREAMRVPFLRDLLISDSIFIASNITFHNLEPLSTYLGTPGDPARGGLTFAEYQRRQEQHRVAEISALLDIPHFAERAKLLYNYDNFVADTGGSLIEVVDVDDPKDAVIQALGAHTAFLYIRGTENDAERLVRRFRKAPKPMYYRPAFLLAKWAEYKLLNDIGADDEVDPQGFAAWGFEALLHDRLPRYQALADRYGYCVEAVDVASVRDNNDFLALMRKAIITRRSS